MRKVFIVLLIALSFQLGATSVKAQRKTCPIGETPFTPGGDCASSTQYIQSKIEVYPLTCQDIPTVRLRRNTNVPTDPGVEPVTVTEDLSNVELGGLGPNAAAYNGNSPDYLAQYYPFNALFDKPLVQTKTPREASRTYWRFLNSYQQANAKAIFLQNFVKNVPPINDDSIVFYSPYPPNIASVSATPTPGTAPSDTTYGFNWGYGHLDPRACQDANGRAVTFLLPLEAPVSQLQEYRDCYKGAATRVVRITSFDGGTDPSVFRTAGSHYQQIFGGDYVELGNELNNLSLEYPNCGGDLAACGTRYANQFRSFRQTFSGNLAAAALDTSNSDFDAAAFLVGAIAAYKSASFITANSYQLGGCKSGYDPQRCTKTSYEWVARQIGAKNIILTEYGLAPGNDNNLLDVVNFYKNNIPTDVLAITPLVRNPCSSAVGQWLRMVDYKFYDVESNLVNPSTCGASATQTLYPDSMNYSELVLRLHDCLKSVPVCEKYLDEYYNLDLRTKAAYDALFPLNFDNVRGYQVLNNDIARENLAYIQAINQGLLNENYGLLNGLSPQWLIDARAEGLKAVGLTNLRKTALADEWSLRGAIIDRAGALDTGTCGSHHGVYLPAPLTHPDGSLSQVVPVPYTVTEETYTDKTTGLEKIRYHLRGQAQGEPVAVLNNPLLSIIDQVVYRGKLAMIDMLLPDALRKDQPSKNLVAPIAYLSSPDNGIKIITQTLGMGRSVIARISGQGHTTLCEFRNKWLIPKSMQDKSLNCDTMQYDQMIAQYYVPDDEAGAPGGSGGFTGVACHLMGPAEKASCPFPTTFYLSAEFAQQNAASCRPEDRAQRGTSEVNKTYDICCPIKESVNNVYAVRSAVCGNAAEINPACGVKNNTLFCWGNNYRTGATDPRFPPPAEGSRKTSGQFTTSDCFMYNGNQYCPSMGSGFVFWCDSNNIFCGG